MRSNALERATSGLDQLMETTALSPSAPHIPLDSAKVHKCQSEPYLVPLKCDSVEGTTEGPTHEASDGLVHVHSLVTLPNLSPDDSA